LRVIWALAQSLDNAQSSLPNLPKRDQRLSCGGFTNLYRPRSGECGPWFRDRGKATKFLGSGTLRLQNVDQGVGPKIDDKLLTEVPRACSILPLHIRLRPQLRPYATPLAGDCVGCRDSPQVSPPLATMLATIDGKILLVNAGRWSTADKKRRLRLGDFVTSSFAAAPF
jgi:hypothetical protein